MCDTQMNIKVKIKTDMKIYKLQRGYINKNTELDSNWQVSTWMSDQLRAGKPCCSVPSHPHQLSLVIHLWVSAVSSSLCAMG